MVLTLRSETSIVPRSSAEIRTRTLEPEQLIITTVYSNSYYAYKQKLSLDCTCTSDIRTSDKSDLVGEILEFFVSKKIQLLDSSFK